MGKFEKPREIALAVLEERERGAAFTEEILDKALSSGAASPADRALARELTCGIVRWDRLLNWLIQRKSTRPSSRPRVQILLRLGLYQLFWLDRIPAHAAVFETVELAKRRGCRAQSGFINAVLRAFLREQSETRRLLQDLRETDPALGYSHPEWLWKRWQSRWQPSQALELLDWNNHPPKTFARLNRIRAASEELLRSWAQENVEFAPVDFPWAESDAVFELKSFPSIASLESFQKGWFYIQDPSTLLAARLLAPKPGDSTLDLCASPGGKTALLAQAMQNRGALLACDLNAERLDRLRENCVRLGVTCVRFARISDRNSGEASQTTGGGFLESSEFPLDASVASPRFNRILIDAPCSNTGVTRRRVDLRWRIRPEEIERLRSVQLNLLSQASRHLKPGGALVYSTCSLEPEENGETVREFLQRHPSFELETERELAPFRDGVDGAYAARLRRVEEGRPSSVDRPETPH